MLTFLAESLQHDEYHHCISRRQASAVMEDFEVVVYRHRRRKWMTSRLLSRAGPFGVWSLEDGSTRTCTRTRRNAAINQANDAALSTFTEISMAESPFSCVSFVGVAFSGVRHVKNVRVGVTSSLPSCPESGRRCGRDRAASHFQGLHQSGLLSQSIHDILANLIKRKSHHS